MAAISAARKRLQVAISSGFGRFPGGTQRTALVTRVSTRRQPVVRVRPVVPQGEAESQQGLVEQGAGEVAGEGAAGAVGARTPGARPTISNRASSAPKLGTGALNHAGLASRLAVR